jgi:hypothetical protein
MGASSLENCRMPKGRGSIPTPSANMPIGIILTNTDALILILCLILNAWHTGFIPVK